MRLQICGLIRNQSVPIRVAFCKRVVGKLFDHVENGCTQFIAIAQLDATRFKTGALFRHGYFVFFATCFSQRVCFGQRIPSKLLRHAHHALLINHEPICVTQQFCSIWMEILILFAIVFVVGKIIVHVLAHWAWTVQSKNCRKMLKRFWHQGTK